MSCTRRVNSQSTEDITESFKFRNCRLACFVQDQHSSTSNNQHPLEALTDYTHDEQRLAASNIRPYHLWRRYTPSFLLIACWPPLSPATQRFLSDSRKQRHALQLACDDKKLPCPHKLTRGLPLVASKSGCPGKPGRRQTSPGGL